jgi:hypothetical protein
MLLQMFNILIEKPYHRDNDPNELLLADWPALKAFDIHTESAEHLPPEAVQVAKEIARIQNQGTRKRLRNNKPTIITMLSGDDGICFRTNLLQDGWLHQGWRILRANAGGQAIQIIFKSLAGTIACTPDLVERDSLQGGVYWIGCGNFSHSTDRIVESYLRLR